MGLGHLAKNYGCPLCAESVFGARDWYILADGNGAAIHQTVVGGARFPFATCEFDYRDDCNGDFITNYAADAVVCGADCFLGNRARRTTPITTRRPEAIRKPAL